MPLLLIIILVQLLACGAEYGNEASVKFITSAGLGQPLGSYYLIQEVHKPAWLIRYGFSDNDLCRTTSGIAEDKTEKFEQQLRESITKAIKLWLLPLQEMDSEIVSEFNFVLVNTKTKDDKNQTERRTHTLVRSEGEALEQLGVVFHCAEKDRDTKYPNSFISIGSNKTERGAFISLPRPKRKYFPNDKMSSEHMFMMTATIHELGHAFGLADTYISSSASGSNTSSDTINYSTGGSDKDSGETADGDDGICFASPF